MEDQVPQALANQLQKLKEMSQGIPTESPVTQSEQPVQTAQNTETPIPQAPESQSQQQPNEVKPTENTAQADQVKPDVDWKHKYQVLDGIHRAETSRMKEEIAKLKQQIQESSQVASPQTFDSKNLSSISEAEVKQNFSEEFIEEWGVDFCKQQLALQKATLANIQQANTKQQEPEVSEYDQSVIDMFYSNLDALNPQWETTYNSEGFKSFLRKHDDLTGKSYGTLLDEAVQKRDAFATNALFQRFGSSSQSPSQQLKNSVDVMPSQVNTQPQVNQSAPVNQAEVLRQLAQLTAQGLTPLEVAEKQKEIMAKAKSMNAQQPQSNAVAFI